MNENQEKISLLQKAQTNIENEQEIFVNDKTHISNPELSNTTWSGKYADLFLTKRDDIETAYSQINDQVNNILDNIEEKITSLESSNIQISSTISSKRMYINTLKNNEKFDNLSFITSNYVKDTMEFDQIAFLLPSKTHVWHIEYEKIAEQKIYIIPVSNQSYLNRIEGTIKDFFEK